MTVVVILAVVFVLYSAGGKKPSATGPRPLTGDQADRLAVSRFLDYQAKGVRFSTTVPTAQGSLPLAGDIDFRRHLGYAATRLDAGGREQTAVLQWNGTTVQTWLDAGDGLAPPARLPSAKPTGRRIVAASSGLDTLLVLLLDLGADRPDNAQLLQQSDARWLRTDTVDGQRVDVHPRPVAGRRVSGRRRFERGRQFRNRPHRRHRVLDRRHRPPAPLLRDHRVHRGHHRPGPHRLHGLPAQPGAVVSAAVAPPEPPALGQVRPIGDDGLMFTCCSTPRGCRPAGSPDRQDPTGYYIVASLG